MQDQSHLHWGRGVEEICVPGSRSRLRGRKGSHHEFVSHAGEQSGSEDIRGSVQGSALILRAGGEPRKGFEQVLMGPGFSFRRAFERRE